METLDQKKTTKKLKPDQVNPQEAKSWQLNFEAEKEETFNLVYPRIVLQEATYRAMTVNNEYRIRVYMGIEEDGKTVCAFAFPAFSVDGSANNFADIPKSVYKLGENNEDWTAKLDKVKECIARWKKWRKTLVEPGNFASKRAFMYKNAYLLTKVELNQIFNWDGEQELELKLGVEKSVRMMLYPVDRNKAMLRGGVESEVFDFSAPCPPFCGPDNNDDDDDDDDDGSGGNP
ncbi:hypothetical protein EMN47_00365 [Prolixibacteraceae bacterium JC049]|nr:hypothetical protein [Prolixibacteraceae bacterium JC049]